MNNEYDFVDKMIFSYCDNKKVPDSVEETIKNTEVKKKNYSFTIYVKRVAIVLIIPILCGAIYMGINSNKDNLSILPDNNVIIADDENNTPNENTTETGHEYPNNLLADYAYKPTPENLYEHADLVVIGKYVKNNKCWVETHHMVYTSDEFEVLEIVKGSYDSSRINIIYSGGTVPLKEVMDKLDEPSKIKYGFSELTEEEIAQKTWDEPSLKIYPDTEYVIFLMEDQEKGRIFRYK